MRIAIKCKILEASMDVLWIYHLLDPKDERSCLANHHVPKLAIV